MLLCRTMSHMNIMHALNICSCVNSHLCNFDSMDYIQIKIANNTIGNMIAGKQNSSSNSPEAAMVNHMSGSMSDFLEGCSMTFWWVVPCLCIPWPMLELRDSYRYFIDIEFFYRKRNLEINNGNNIDNSYYTLNNSITPAWNPLVLYFNIPILLSCIIYFLIGLSVWTLFEYVAHRFLFHWEPPLELKYFNADRLNVISFLVHGMHHLIPTDELRLVFPPAINYTWINNTYIIYTLFISNWFIKCISCWFSIWISII